MQNNDIYEWISTIPPQSVEQLAERWRRCESRLGPDGEIRLNCAVRRITDGAYVGKFDAIISSEKIATNIGYFFIPKYWGEGYASESVQAISKHLIDHGIKELRAMVTVGNTASCRVLEKAGYRKTRIVSANDTIRGIKFDEVEYILKATLNS